MNRSVIFSKKSGRSWVPVACFPTQQVTGVYRAENGGVTVQLTDGSTVMIGRDMNIRDACEQLHTALGPTEEEPTP